MSDRVRRVTLMLTEDEWQYYNGCSRYLCPDAPSAKGDVEGEILRHLRVTRNVLQAIPPDLGMRNTKTSDA